MLRPPRLTAAHETGVADPGYNELGFLLGASGFSAAIAPGKLLDAARSVDKLLFACKKGMTSRANADLNTTTRGAGMIHRAACAHHIGLVVFWMNGCFHLLKEARNVSAQGDSCKR